MAFSIQQVWQVVASHLKSPVRLETNRIQQITVSEDGAAHEQQNKVFFVRLAKGDVSTMRLLLGMTPRKGEGNMANTTVIEDIKKLRDQKRDELIEAFLAEKSEAEMREEAAKMDGKIDVSIEDSTPKKSRASAAITPKKVKGVLPVRYVTVVCPPVLPDLASVNMMVLIEQKIHLKNPLYLEVHLSEITLQYMHTAAIQQIKSKIIHNVHPSCGRPKLGVKGLSRINLGRHEGKYRFMVNGKRPKIFSAIDDNDAKRQAKHLKTQEDDEGEVVASAAGAKGSAEKDDEEEDAATDDGN